MDGVHTCTMVCPSVFEAMPQTAIVFNVVRSVHEFSNSSVLYELQHLSEAMSSYR